MSGLRQFDQLLFVILLTLVAGNELDPQSAANQKPSSDKRDVIPEWTSRAVEQHRLLVLCTSDLEALSAQFTVPSCPTDTFVNITSISCRPPAKVAEKSQSCGGSGVEVEFSVTLNCDPAERQIVNAAEPENNEQAPRVKLQQQTLSPGQRRGRCQQQQQQENWRRLLTSICRGVDSVTIDYSCQSFGHIRSAGIAPLGHGRVRRSGVAASRGVDSTPALRRRRTTSTTAAAAAAAVVTAAAGSRNMDGTAAASVPTSSEAVLIAAATDPRDCDGDDNSCGSLAVEWAWTWSFMKDNREYFILYSLLGASIGAVFILALGILFLVVIRPRQLAARQRRRTPVVKQQVQSTVSSAASTQTSPTAESAFLLSSVDTPDRYRQQPQPRSVFFSSSVDSSGSGTGNGDVPPPARLNNVGSRPTGGILRTPSSETSATALLNNSSSPSEGGASSVHDGPVGAAPGDADVAVGGGGPLGASRPVDVEVSPLSAPDWAEFGELDSSYTISRGDSYTNPYRHDTCRTIDSRTSSSRSHRHRK